METNKIEVFKAINAVQSGLCKVGISKGSKNTSQGYAFRGIDSVYNALSRLLSENNLVIIPIVKNREVYERKTQRGGTLFYTVLEVEYNFVSSIDGSMHSAVVFGEAMDSGDKSTNKAMSAAYKYLCLQTFCIPTEGDNDADSQTHEVVHAAMSLDDFRRSVKTSLIAKFKGDIDGIKAFLEVNSVKAVDKASRPELEKLRDVLSEVK